MLQSPKPLLPAPTTKQNERNEQKTANALSARHAAEHLLTCWKGGGVAGPDGLDGVK